MTVAETTELLARAHGRLGHVTLNRPRAMNALTLGMVRALATALDAWEHDDAVAVVLLDGAGERGFCAGGDIVALHDAARSGEHAPAHDFWREEYRLDARIARYPKPVVALMDGVVMGGGVGLSAHASHRLASERLVVAMPEVGIGFAPDVGGTHLLARAPGELGTHLALTGSRVGAADAILCGLADRAIATDAIAGLADRLAAGGELEATLAAVAAPPLPPAPLAGEREWIDACYAADTIAEIVARLRARPEPAARAAAGAIAAASPTAVAVALRALRTARELGSLEAALAMEYRVSCAFLDVPDFVEGIRAAVIDKDRSPRWVPARPEDVTEAAVARHFAPRPGDELELGA